MTQRFRLTRDKDHGRQNKTISEIASALAETAATAGTPIYAPFQDYGGRELHALSNRPKPHPTAPHPRPGDHLRCTQTSTQVTSFGYPEQHACVWVLRGGYSRRDNTPDNIAAMVFENYFDRFDAERSLLLTKRWLSAYRPDLHVEVIVGSANGYSQGDWRDVFAADEDGYGSAESHIEEFRQWAGGDVWVPQRRGCVAGLLRHRRGPQRRPQQLRQSVWQPPRRRHSFWVSHYPYEGDHTEHDRHLAVRPRDYGLPLVHGHIHGVRHFDDRMFNVGVDVNNWRPVHQSTIIDWPSALPARRQLDTPETGVTLFSLSCRLITPEQTFSA